MFLFNFHFVTLTNKNSGSTLCKIGFSWSILFLLWFVPLFRRDWLGFVLYVVLLYFTRGISILVFPFFYNWFYITQLLLRGWQPATINDWQMLKSNYFFVRDWNKISRQGKEQNYYEYSGNGQNDTYEDDPAFDAQSWKEELSRAVDVEWKDDEDDEKQ